MINNPTVRTLALLAGLHALNVSAQYNPKFYQNGSSNTTEIEFQTNDANDGTATFILLGDGRFRIGSGDSITRKHNYAATNTSYTATSYFVEKYKDDKPTSRSVNVSTGSGASGSLNPDLKMTACAQLGTSWSPSPGKEHFTILSFTNSCSSTKVSGKLKFYFSNRQQFSTSGNSLLIYNSWIKSPQIQNSDDSDYDLMLTADYENLEQGEIRHIYLYGKVQDTVAVGAALRYKFKMTGLSCGVTESSGSLETKKYPHDPNAKYVDREEVCARNAFEHELQYKISFLNDGEWYADTVYIADEFDSKLLWQTTHFLHGSAPCKLTVGSVSEFRFPGIYLPGLNQSFPNLFTYNQCEGFLAFSINTIPCLPHFTAIFNEATITFDTQMPIITTKAVTRTGENSCTIPCPPPALRPQGANGATALSVAPNPVSDQVSLMFTPTEAWNIQMLDLQGRIVYERAGTATFQQEKLEVDTQLLPSGLYLIALKSGSAIQLQKLRKE